MDETSDGTAIPSPRDALDDSKAGHAACVGSKVSSVRNTVQQARDCSRSAEDQPEASGNAGKEPLVPISPSLEPKALRADGKDSVRERAVPQATYCKQKDDVAGEAAPAHHDGTVAADYTGFKAAAFEESIAAHCQATENHRNEPGIFRTSFATVQHAFDPGFVLAKCPEDDPLAHGHFEAMYHTGFDAEEVPYNSPMHFEAARGTADAQPHNYVVQATNQPKPLPFEPKQLSNGIGAISPPSSQFHLEEAATYSEDLATAETPFVPADQVPHRDTSPSNRSPAVISKLSQALKDQLKRSRPSTNPPWSEQSCTPAEDTGDVTNDEKDLLPGSLSLTDAALASFTASQTAWDAPLFDPNSPMYGPYSIFRMSSRSENLAYHDCVFTGLVHPVTGLAHGYGTKLHNNGNSMICGQWVNGVPNGESLFVSANKDEYRGSWLNGAKHGRGVLRKANGAVLEEVYDQGVRTSRKVVKEPVLSDDEAYPDVGKRKKQGTTDGLISPPPPGSSRKPGVPRFPHRKASAPSPTAASHVAVLAANSGGLKPAKLGGASSQRTLSVRTAAAKSEFPAARKKLETLDLERGKRHYVGAPSGLSGRVRAVPEKNPLEQPRAKKSQTHPASPELTVALLLQD
ncbi:hypothetical protein DIPPA_29256 [Diplonema papillatum]|nr:hypothetical protein DIPPA_29256 [Diplonema papillatum]